MPTNNKRNITAKWGFIELVNVKNITRRAGRFFFESHWTGRVSRPSLFWDVMLCILVVSYRHFLSFNSTQSRVVIGLLTGHNTLRRHLYMMGLSNNPICRKCGTEEETSVHILCECGALASLIHIYLGSFFLDLGDIRVLDMGLIWNFAEGTGLL